MNILFHGSSSDVYVHWLILSLGIAIFVSGLAIFTSCRVFARKSGLSSSKNSLVRRSYSTFSRYHSYYWAIFGFVLVLHVMVTSVHLALPVIGEPYFLAQQAALYTAIGNILLVFIMLFSCRSFTSTVFAITNRSVVNNNAYRRFYNLHAYFWIVLATSISIHIVSGMIHSINT